MSISEKALITKRLREWREVQAATENVELYRIIQNETINLIADSFPETNVDLLSIKGLGPKKVQKYGPQILQIVATARLPVTNDDTINEDAALTVSEFLSRINFSLAKKTVRIQGEVYGSVDQRGNAIYFKVKDALQNALLSCFVWADTFTGKGSYPTEGAEVVLEGQIQIYPPTGRFSLQVKLIELHGEGLLKAAYDRLRLELDASGAFDLDRKRSITTLPRRIALITAAGSDAETDFITHVGKHGFTIDRFDVRVEGIRSESEISETIEVISSGSVAYDVVVITRGGGSLESLQAYNSKKVINQVLACRFPTISAVGHERDVTLCDLVADVRASTPTDAGKFIDQLIIERLRDEMSTVLNQKQLFEARINTIKLENFTIVTLGKNKMNNHLNAIQRTYNTSINSLGLQLRKITSSTRNVDTIVRNNQFAIRKFIETQRLRITSDTHRATLSATNTMQRYNIGRMASLVRDQFGQTVINSINANLNNLTNYTNNISDLMSGSISSLRFYCNSVSRNIELSNPQRVLEKGYAIVSHNKTTVTSAQNILPGDRLKIQLIDGTISATKD